MKKRIGIGVLLLSAAAVASAETRGTFYLTPSIGQGMYDLSREDFDEATLLTYESMGLTVVEADSSLDDSGTAWSFVGGWKFSRYFAAEVGYLDLGKAPYRAEGTVIVPGLGLVDSTFGADISVKGPTVAVVGSYPLTQRFDIHGKAGVFFAKTKFDLTASFDGESDSGGFHAQSKDPFFGLGTAFHFTDRLAATLDYALHKKVGDENEIGEADVDSVTLGMVFKF